MALKKKQTRKSGAIPEHDRQNLELLHQSYLHAMVMVANVVLIAAVMGGVAYWQLGAGFEGNLVIWGVIVIDLLLVCGLAYFYKKARKIRKVLGIGETAEKYGV